MPRSSCNISSTRAIFTSSGSIGSPSGRLTEKRGYFGEVAEAFQVCIDLVHGKYETQVDSHRCVQGNDILAITVDLQLECIHAAFTAEYFVGQFLVSGQHRFTGIVYLLVDECPSR